MDSNLRSICRFATILVLTKLTFAQVPSVRTILDLPESEQRNFITETINAGFPDGRADQMTMLILNRSSLVLPLLERRTEVELMSQSPSQVLIETTSEMIAYAGDSQALREVGRLIAIDDGRFGPLVNRTLGNAMSFRNPFTVAYRGVDVESEAVGSRIGAWADAMASAPRMQRLWAQAMIERYGRVPTQDDWASDPIVSRMKTRRFDQLKENVLRFASAAKSGQSSQQ